MDQKNLYKKAKIDKLQKMTPIKLSTVNKV